MSDNRKTSAKKASRGERSHQSRTQQEGSTRQSTVTLIDTDFEELIEVKNKKDLPIYEGLSKEEVSYFAEEMEKMYQDKVQEPVTEGLPVDLDKRFEVIQKIQETVSKNQKFISELGKNFEQSKIDLFLT